jgi:hypothetical protein
MGMNIHLTNWFRFCDVMREMRKVVAVVVIVVAFTLTLGVSSEQLSSRECENLGFTGLALCSDCNTLSEYVKDKGYIHFRSLSLANSISLVRV